MKSANITWRPGARHGANRWLPGRCQNDGLKEKYWIPREDSNLN